MVYAYAGRRSPSLPDGAEDRVRRRLRELFEQASPSVVVGAAACGADLILLEEALRLRRAGDAPAVEVVLPTPSERFREESVEPGWRERFDDVVARADAMRTLAGEAEDPYAVGNVAILDAAERMAAARHESATAIVVASPGEGSSTERFAEQAELRGMSVLRVDPAA